MRNVGYNQGGLEGLGDRRKNNGGKPTLIDDVTQAQLWQALQGNADDDGYSTGFDITSR